MAEEEASQAVFADCVFAVVPSKDLDSQYAVALQSTLEANGGIVCELKADGSIRLDQVSHIISSTSDFPQYRLACDHMVAVVKPSWVQASLVKNKQAALRPYNPDPRLIFSDVVITCAGLAEGDKDAIIGATVAMGGLESSNLTKLVTHIIALDEDHPKCQMARQKGMKCKIVLPHWFDDCFKLGKRIDERPYTLPDPEILRKSADEDVRLPNTSQMEGAISPRPDFLPTPTDTPKSSRKLHVFNSKRVMLADDLTLGSRLRQILEDIIEQGGGSITTTVHKADIYVCHYREGRDYTIASRAGKDVGNLAWLYWLITQNEWTSPLRRLMHYPVPRGGIEGFDKLKITLSNYGGEARLYLENLVQAAGAEFTKSMKQDNTHLITARDRSEKCDAAREWGINMVNHLWIEESYAKCRLQPLTMKRYTHFPHRTNLGEIIGQTQFDLEALERLYFPDDPDESPSRPQQARPLTTIKDHNVPVPKPIEPPTRGLSTEVSPSRNPPPPQKQKATARATPSRPASSVMTPIANRLIGAGKENETPSSTGSRGAKDRALSKLQELAPDIALYEKEKRRGSQGIWGGRHAADQIDKERSKKRTSTSAELDVDNDTSDAEETANKRARSVASPVQIRLSITAYKKWVGAQAKEDQDRKKLREMGILVTQDPYNCTHLAAPYIVRTQKFLTALACGATILSSDFIDACLKDGEIPPPEDFLLKDAENEKRFRLKLKDAVSRAKKLQRHLLQDIAVCCTAQINNGPDTYKAIVEANGGSFYVYRGRGGFVLQKDEDEVVEPSHEPLYLLSGVRPEEKALWPKFAEMAKQGGMEPRIVISEWLLDTAMAQELKWDSKYLVVNAIRT